MEHCRGRPPAGTQRRGGKLWRRRCDANTHRAVSGYPEVREDEQARRLGLIAAMKTVAGQCQRKSYRSRPATMLAGAPSLLSSQRPPRRWHLGPSHRNYGATAAFARLIW